MAKSSFELKLLIDKESDRVLFAETNKDAVDFLFSILSLPVATVVKLLQKQGIVGSLANLYESLEILHDSYIQVNKSKNAYLAPTSTSSVPLLLPANRGNKTFYKCVGGIYACNNNYVTDDPQAVCPRCRSIMHTKMEYVEGPTPSTLASVVEGGIVKEVVTYMVLDDLVVKPMSTISSITLLNKLNIINLGVLEEQVVNLGMEEAVKILSSLLKSKTVLTDVFLKNGK